ncbi:protein of unknown function - conserved [Leishmania donovani]|uniref:Uncharacterized protein n=3 Tax=Leishmania donovani species complex TaxID=38574 RepID=A4I8W8_LEIIN|nr:conserved hypothetical protein [Leishmania infantum JPCM5]XP_003863933.1 hypothetical protein, conserved [Leishmania donovani]CAC9531227.1 hypothetical_protein_-_conserved [Leishmania infantum]AYU82083.1 hypothetical protein LdCL_330017000 [Leishmania donovani]TPP53762.1 hypothetical protein CGC21_38065 [Leishmania donovani]TPP55585.1 hypothetical protein CGC20_10895 [Leishmania donovani]CAJ1992087.1 protein of unknown function - conserved [Leishmania donovani]|eukprot:XP_001468187.1 conserved hypothetical protein [Leishmania infantum JPCM5]
MGCSASKSKEVRRSGKPGASAATASSPIGASANGARAQKPTAETAPAPPAQPNQNGTTLPANKSPSSHSVEAPSGRAADANHDNKSTNVDSTEAPDKGPRQNGAGLGNGDVDENGNAVLLPKGVWVKTEGTPYYYCLEENLYFHPPSCQFYDPTNEMWYDPDKDEWYRDDGSDAEAA